MACSIPRVVPVSALCCRANAGGKVRRVAPVHVSDSQAAAPPGLRATIHRAHSPQSVDPAERPQIPHRDARAGVADRDPVRNRIRQAGRCRKSRRTRLADGESAAPAGRVLLLVRLQRGGQGIRERAPAFCMSAPSISASLPTSSRSWSSSRRSASSPPQSSLRS